MTRRAWLLNLDADDELADPSHATSSILRDRIRGLRDKLSALIPNDDLVIDEGVDAAGCVGIAWCPTPRAIAEIEGSGASAPPHPSFDVLRRVNDRRFHCELFGAALGGHYASTRAEVDEILAAMTRPLVLKRAHSFAGRGLLVLQRPELERRDTHWIDTSLKLGGLYVEPWHRRLADHAVHGFVDARGAAFGEPTTQVVHHRGAWRATELATQGELTDVDRATLRALQETAANALLAAGYFGPFGVDVIRREQPPSLIPCEINARYTMGWAVGMRAYRPDLG